MTFFSGRLELEEQILGLSGTVVVILSKFGFESPKLGIIGEKGFEDAKVGNPETCQNCWTSNERTGAITKNQYQRDWGGPLKL